MKWVFMLKNTYYVILFLSVFAALVVGLNIGKKVQQYQSVHTQTQEKLSAELFTPTPVTMEPYNETSSISGTNTTGTQSGVIKNATQSGSSAKTTLFTSTSCGISVTYPDTVTVEESSTDTKGAIFLNKTNPTDIVVLTCQKDIPKPPISAENTETKIIGNVTAKLYHDSSQKDGTKVDALIFTHPKTNLDILIGGYGTLFTSIIQSLKIL